MERDTYKNAQDTFEYLFFKAVSADQDRRREEIAQERAIHEAEVMEKMDELPLERVLDRPDLVAVPVYEAIKHWPVKSEIDPKEFMVFQSDPSLRKSHDVSESTGIPLSFGAKSLILKVDDNAEYVACVVPGDTEADFDGVVKTQMNVNQVSLAPRKKTERLTGMQTGSITPIGLPSRWPVLVDDRLPQKRVLMGSGLRRSKLIVPGAALLELPNVSTIMALGKTQVVA